MNRLFCLLLGLLCLPAISQAETPPAGTWKLTLITQNRPLTFLLAFEQKDGVWTGKYLGANLPIRTEPSVVDVALNDTRFSFSIKLGESLLSFDGRPAKDGKKILGSFSVFGDIQLVELQPTKLTKLDDRFALLLEEVMQMEPSGSFFDAAFALLREADPKKLPPDVARTIADKLAKAAESYGDRWLRTVMLRTAVALSTHEGYFPIAIEQARRAERMLAPTDDSAVQLSVLETLAAILRRAKQDGLKDVETRLARLEARDFLEYARKQPLREVTPFAGRKGKSDRVVLVELFTGSECPPCVAADLAFEALERAYKPSEVVLLQYHLHIPRPDPLTNPDCEARAKFYGEKFEGTPALFLNGAIEPSGGGGSGVAKIKFDAYRKLLDEWLEKPAVVKLALTATLSGDTLHVKANVADLAVPGEKTTLRLALVEERVRFTGGNGLRYHHAVVRSFLGGVQGFPLTTANAEKTLSVQIDAVREGLRKYLSEFETKADFASDARPLDLKKLRVVAFVQNDVSGEVLNAVQSEVAAKE